MTYIVLNCRDLEHRAKAIKRLEDAGRTFVAPPEDYELQIYNYCQGHELAFDLVSESPNYEVHTKIKDFIAAMDKSHPLTKE